MEQMLDMGGVCLDTVALESHDECLSTDATHLHILIYGDCDVPTVEQEKQWNVNKQYIFKVFRSFVYSPTFNPRDFYHQQIAKLMHLLKNDTPWVPIVWVSWQHMLLNPHIIQIEGLEGELYDKTDPKILYGFEKLLDGRMFFSLNQYYTVDEVGNDAVLRLRGDAARLTLLTDLIEEHVFDCVEDAARVDQVRKDLCAKLDRKLATFLS